MAKKKNTVRADGRIAVQVFLGEFGGKRKYKTVYGKNQKEADAKAQELKMSMYKGIDITADRDTFEFWMEAWSALKSAEVSYGRMESYKRSMKKYEPLFNHPITRLKTADFQQIILALAKENPNTGEPSAKSSLKQIRSVALQVCQMAIDNRVMDYNPVSAVKIPRVPESSTRRALTQEEQQWIIETPHRAQTAAMIMMFAGLRRGELLALTWSDISFKDATIDINKTIEFINGQPVLKNTAKSKNSIRTINIPNILVNFLREKKKDCTDSVIVCPSAKGQLMSEVSWRRLWDSYLTDLNIKYGNFSNQISDQPKSKFQPQGVPFIIPRFTAHWLRHTYATMLYFAEVDVLTAKEQLGHSDVQTTLNIYTHLDGKHKRKSMDKLNSYIAGGTNKDTHIVKI
ncbi:Tyrosine recombinase XerC [anaerobic digester metagenome]